MNALRAMAVAFLLGSAAVAWAGEVSPIVEKGPGGEPRPWTNIPLPPESQSFRFAFLPDRTGGHREGIFEDAIAKLNLLDPAFVISVGDLVEGFSGIKPGQTDIPAAMKGQWDELETLVSPLRMRLYLLAGNHDYYKQNDLGRIWNERLGRAYQSFTYGNVLFLMLNTEEGGYADFGREQTDWAIKTLQDNPDVRWTFVVMHVPSWVLMRHKGWNEIESALAGRRYTAVCGDAHTYSLYHYNDADHIVLATAGGSSRLRGAAEGSFDHVTLVSFREGENEPKWANLELKGIYAKDLRTRRFDPDEADLKGALEAWTDPILLRPDYSGGPFTLTARNNSTRPLRVEGKVTSQAGAVVTPETFSFTAPPKSDTAFALTVTADPPLAAGAASPFTIELRGSLADSDRDLSADLTLPARPVQTYAAPRLKTGAAVDGKLDEWEGVQFYDIASPRDPQQRGASFATASDGQSVLVAVKVRDPDPGLPKEQNPQQHAEFLYHDVAGAIFQENGIEVRLDARAEPERSRETGWQWMTGHLFLGYYPGSADEAAVQMLAEKLPVTARSAVLHEPGGYTVELAIPMSYVKERQGDGAKAYRLNLVVHDRTADGQFVRYSWQPDWRSPENAFGSGTFFME